MHPPARHAAHAPPTDARCRYGRRGTTTTNSNAATTTAIAAATAQQATPGQPTSPQAEHQPQSAQQAREADPDEAREADPDDTGHLITPAQQPVQPHKPSSVRAQDEIRRSHRRDVSGWAVAILTNLFYRLYSETLNFQTEHPSFMSNGWLRASTPRWCHGRARAGPIRAANRPTNRGCSRPPATTSRPSTGSSNRPSPTCRGIRTALGWRLWRPHGRIRPSAPSTRTTSSAAAPQHEGQSVAAGTGAPPPATIRATLRRCRRRIVGLAGRRGEGMLAKRPTRSPGLRG